MGKKNLFKVCMISIILASAIAIFYFSSKTIMLPSNIEKSVSKFWDNNVSIKRVEDFEAYGKKFKFVLSTSKDNDNYKYMNCYEEKVNGLFYKFYQGAEQGGSNGLFSVSNIFINNGQGLNKENYITVVYGNNTDSKITNYEISIREGEGSFTSNIANEDYFMDITTGKYQTIVNATDKDGNDKTEVFCD